MSGATPRRVAKSREQTVTGEDNTMDIRIHDDAGTVVAIMALAVPRYGTFLTGSRGYIASGKATIAGKQYQLTASVVETLSATPEAAAKARAAQVVDVAAKAARAAAKAAAKATAIGDESPTAKLPAHLQSTKK